MVRSRTVLALCDPEPFTVATWMLKSLTTGSRTAPGPAPCTANSVVAINTPYQRWINAVGKHSIIRQRASGGKWDSVAVPPAISVRCGRSNRYEIRKPTLSTVGTLQREIGSLGDGMTSCERFNLV